MEELQDLYLVFRSRELYYLLPLSWVGYVSDDREAQEELTVLDFELLAGGSCVDVPYRYMIVLEYQGEKLGVVVEHVLGIQEIPQERIVLLDEPVINENNRYLLAAVPMKIQEEGEVAAYLLSPEFLYEAAAGI